MELLGSQPSVDVLVDELDREHKGHNSDEHGIIKVSARLSHVIHQFDVHLVLRCVQLIESPARVTSFQNTTFKKLSFQLAII